MSVMTEIILVLPRAFLQQCNNQRLISGFHIRLIALPVLALIRVDVAADRVLQALCRNCGAEQLQSSLPYSSCSAEALQDIVDRRVPHSQAAWLLQLTYGPLRAG